jgi:hypothetical protein
VTLLRSEAPSKGYLLLPSGIGFTREQAAVMSALHLFPGWPPLVDALRHLAIQAQDRMMSRYASNDDTVYERGFINALEEVVALVEDVIPGACATLLAEESVNARSGEAGFGGSDRDA